jgi:hypothetical protein
MGISPVFLGLSPVASLAAQSRNDFEAGGHAVRGRSLDAWMKLLARFCIGFKKIRSAFTISVLDFNRSVLDFEF